MSCSCVDVIHSHVFPLIYVALFCKRNEISGYEKAAADGSKFVYCGNASGSYHSFEKSKAKRHNYINERKSSIVVLSVVLLKLLFQCTEAVLNLMCTSFFSGKHIQNLSLCLGNKAFLKTNYQKALYMYLQNLPSSFMLVFQGEGT